MTSSIEKQISDVLRGKSVKNSDETTALIQQVKDSEIPKVEAELAAYQEAAADPALLGEDQEAAREMADQKFTSTEHHLKRLKRALTELTATRDKLVIAERDAMQKAAFALFMKQHAATKSEVTEMLDRFPAFARLLHKVAALKEEGRRFSNPPNPNHGAPINPQDDMVSSYSVPAPLLPDAMLNGIRLVDAAGNVLYAHVDVTPRFVPTASPEAPRHKGNCLAEKEALRQAREQQEHAGTILRGIEYEAEARGISVEQAAILAGHGDEDLQKLRDRAGGKYVRAAHTRHLDALHEVAMKEAGNNPAQLAQLQQSYDERKAREAREASEAEAKTSTP